MSLTAAARRMIFPLASHPAPYGDSRRARRLLASLATVLITLSVLVPPSTAMAESLSLADATAILDNAFKTKFRTKAQLDAQVTKLFGPLPPDKQAYARKAMAEMFSHEQLPGRIAQLVHPLLASGMAYDDVMSSALEAALSMQMSGIRRLPDSTLVRFYEFVGEHMAWLPASNCKALLLGQASAATMARWERKHAASLPLARFKEWYAIYQEALAAELSDFPPLRNVTRTQAQSAQRVLAAAIKERLSRTQASTVSRLSRAADDLASAPAEDACAFGLMVTEAILDMAEPYRGWQLTVAILSAQ